MLFKVGKARLGESRGLFLSCYADTVDFSYLAIRTSSHLSSGQTPLQSFPTDSLLRLLIDLL